MIIRFGKLRIGQKFTRMLDNPEEIQILCKITNNRAEGKDKIWIEIPQGEQVFKLKDDKKIRETVDNEQTVSR